MTKDWTKDLTDEQVKSFFELTQGWTGGQIVGALISIDREQRLHELEKKRLARRKEDQE